MSEQYELEAYNEQRRIDDERIQQESSASALMAGCAPIEDLNAIAGKACIDLYLSLHVSQMREQTKQVKKAWSAGQELYLATKQGA